jgi:CheY-like chemotaxis protein
MFTNQKRTCPARVVLAEDDPATARLIEIAMKRTGIPHHLEMVHDGDAVITAVRKHRTPDLLLLDLHMPGKDGFEVLEYFKRDVQLRHMPVVMFSDSDCPADVSRAYDLHVNAYVKKTSEFADLCHTIDTLLRFWLQTVVSPA